MKKWLYLLSLMMFLVVSSTAGTNDFLNVKEIKAAKASTQFTKSSLRLGQQMHKAYHAGKAGKEFRLLSGRRIDYLDVQNGIIYELKPNNPRALLQGRKQLQMYLEELRRLRCCKSTLSLNHSMENSFRYLLIIDSKDFKKLFGEVSKTNEFKVPKSSVGHITANETPEYKAALDFDESMDDSVKNGRLEKLFQNHIVPFTQKPFSKSGIKELAEKGEVFLLPAVKKELGVA